MMESTNPPAQSRAGRNHTEVDRLKLKSAAKHAAALLLGILILNGFCAWYYNPAPYEKSPDRATDVVRRPGAVNAQAKEGIGVHRIDANGYNNPAMGDGEAVAVLMMGSSHTEGFNVPEGCDVSSLLGEKLRAAGREGRVYNIGMSAHNFKNCARNLANALERFRPTDCVVIEKVERNISNYLENPPILTPPQAELPAELTISNTDSTVQVINCMNDANYYTISGMVEEGRLEPGSEVLVRVNGKVYRTYQTDDSDFLLSLKKAEFAADTADVQVYVVGDDTCVQVLFSTLTLPQ